MTTRERINNRISNAKKALEPSSQRGKETIKKRSKGFAKKVAK